MLFLLLMSLSCLSASETAVSNFLDIEMRGLLTKKEKQEVFNNLNSIVSPISSSPVIQQAVEVMLNAPLSNDNAKALSVQTLKTIDASIKANQNILLVDDGPTLFSSSLLPVQGSYILDCDSSSFIYVEALERLFIEKKFAKEKFPIVLLVCYPEHVLIRWYFSDGDQDYIDWEATRGFEAKDKRREYYAKNCRELNVFSDEFESLAYFDRGNQRSDQKEYNKAKKDYSKAIKRNSEDDAYYNNRGVAKNNLKKYKKAMKDTNEAIRLNPDEPDYYRVRAYEKYKLGFPAAAAVEIDEADKRETKKKEAIDLITGK